MSADPTAATTENRGATDTMSTVTDTTYLEQRRAGVLGSIARRTARFGQAMRRVYAGGAYCGQ